ncbi:polymer-forming cytoskeletal protein [Chloroflexi bacterium TSY]|nr:polymer-forming cytoskeletal protein [Chloroflexi bacterium TSY]
MRFLKESRRVVTGQLVLAVLLVALLMVGVTQTAYATDFRGGDTIVVNAEEVIDDDLFIAGQTVVVNGTVNGNLFATGTSVTVNGRVDGSLFIAGQELVSNGTVDGSVYAGGYAFALGPEASIGRNLNFGGFSLTTAQGSQISRSLYGGGYQMILDGEVMNDVNIGAGALELNGIVGGDVLGEVDSSANGETVYIPPFAGVSKVVQPGLRVSESAQVGGTVNVVVNAAPAVTDTTNPLIAFVNQHLRWVLGESISLLLVGALFLMVWPKAVKAPSDEVQSHWLSDLGVGLLTVVVIVLALPLLLILLVALAVLGGFLTLGQLAGHILGLGLTSIGLGLAIVFFIMAMLTKIIVAYAGGRLILVRLIPNMEEGRLTSLLALALGILVYMLLRAIPFGIGWITGMLVTLIGLGAIYFVVRNGGKTSTIASPPVGGMPRELPA